MTCKHIKTTLGKTIMASGAYHIWERCCLCGRNARGNGQYISKKKLPPNIDIETLPIFANYLDNSEPCAVCGDVGAELHHWAPKELFPESFEQWPQSYLCPEHHNEWHRAVTIPLRTLRKRAVNNE